VYQWKRNSVNIGTGGSVFTSSTLSNNDTISCTLTSNAPCITINTVNSNKIIVKFGTSVKTMAYIANAAAGGNKLNVLNTETGIIEATIPIASSISFSVGVAVSPDGRKVYVTNYNGDSVVVVNTLTNTVDTK